MCTDDRKEIGVTIQDRIKEYSMEVTASLRSKLGAILPVLVEHKAPGVHQPVMVRRPGGEWASL